MNNPNDKMYYFIDINVKTRQLIGWGTETRQYVETELSPGFHRVFLSKGQFNKLERQLKDEAE